MIHLKKPQLDHREYDAVLDVLKSGVIAQGPKVKEFEEKFSHKCGAKYGVAVNSGTAALHCILLALGVGPGDEVICTSFSFIATASPILMCGAKPVFVDIDANSYNIDVTKIEGAVTSKTKAVIAVNLFGKLADWGELNRLCSKRNLYLLEDAAQSHFAHNGQTMSGNFATASWFSFYATKNMMTAEGGMVVTNNEQIDQSVRRIRQHGMSAPGMYDYEQLGYNFRSTDINAAIGLVQLEKIDGFNLKRIGIAKRYNDAFSIFPELNLPVSNYCGDHVYHLYTIGLKDSSTRDELVKMLKDANIGCGVYYPTPLSDLSIFKAVGSGKLLHNAKNASETVLTIPCEPYMEDDDIAQVIDIFIDCYKTLNKEL
jgi:dTDP-4-amino-4,6-dideoxygalactose transaminase